MKKIIMLFVILFIGCKNSSSSKLETSGNVNSSEMTISFDTIKLAKGAIFYQCPMDLEVISDKPGPCPKCGMDLEQEVKQ